MVYNMINCLVTTPLQINLAGKKD